MAGAEEKEPENIVHRNAIFCETIHKEQRDQKLYTSYGVNPYKKMHVVAGKPNSPHDSADAAEDDEFLQTYREAQGTPRSRYSYPQTEAQEIGWDTKPLVEQPRNDQNYQFRDITIPLSFSSRLSAKIDSHPKKDEPLSLLRSLTGTTFSFPLPSTTKGIFSRPINRRIDDAELAS